MKKLTKSVVVASLALSLGVSAFAVISRPHQAATVVSQSRYEKVLLFSKGEIESIAGRKLTLTSAAQVRSTLASQGPWQKAGFSAAEAKRVAERFAISPSQALGILKTMANNTNQGLKVVLVNKPYHNSVNIGSQRIKETEKPANPSKPNETEKPQVSDALKKIDVEIEYQKRDIEFKYEVKSNKIKAEYENEFTGEKLKDAAAKKKIEGIIKGIDLRKASQNSIATHLRKAVGGSNNFKKMKVKIEFEDKTEREFKLK